MGLISWIMQGCEGYGDRHSVSQQPQIPSFEQLEPRVLLSADVCSVPDLQPLDSCEEPVIYVDLDPASEASEIQCDSETVDPLASQSVTPSNALPVSQSAMAGELTTIQQDEIQPSLAGASEDLLLYTSDFTPQTSVLGPAQNRGPPTEIMFFDSSPKHDFQLETPYSSHVLLSVLPVNTPGIEYITSTLSTYQDISAIHIVTHGAPGQINIGSDVLEAVSLQTRAQDLAAWGNALIPGGDILFYGCSVAQGNVGGGLIDRIAALSRADVAASIDNTGASDLGGNWILEYHTGPIEAGRTTPTLLEHSERYSLLLGNTGFTTLESAGDTQFTISLPYSAPSDADEGLTVNYTVGGTATPGIDYTALSGSVIVLQGQNTATINVDIIDDTIVESDETIALTLQDSSNTAGFNIVVNGDFESGNTSFASDYYNSPGDLFPERTYDIITSPINSHTSFADYGDHTSGSGNMMVVNGASIANLAIWQQTVSVVQNTTYDFAAYLSSAYAQNPAQLQFSVNGTVIGTLAASSTTGQWDEFFATWHSGSATSATISIVNSNMNPSGNDFALDDIYFGTPVFSQLLIGTITNDDSTVFTVNDGSGYEDSTSLTVVSDWDDGTAQGWTLPSTGDGRWLLGNPSGDGYVYYNDGPGSGNGPFLYAPTAFLGDLNRFGSGATLEFDFKILNTFRDIDSAASVTIGNGTDYRGFAWALTDADRYAWRHVSIPLEEAVWSGASGNWMDIITNVTEMRFSGDRVSGNYNEMAYDNITLRGAGPITFTVSLSNPVDVATSVDVSTGDGTALLTDGDYTALAGQTLSFAAGVTSQTFDVIPTIDEKVEPNETFSVSLSNAVDGGRAVTASSSNGVGTILDDDSAPVADAGGPYTINEDDSLSLDASGTTDGDSASLTYRWDVDGDGDFDETVTGVQPTLTWTQLVPQQAYSGRLID